VKDRDDCIRIEQHRDETLQKLGQVEKDRDDVLHRCEQKFVESMKSSDFDVSPVQQRGDTLEYVEPQGSTKTRFSRPTGESMRRLTIARWMNNGRTFGGSTASSSSKYCISFQKN
jgi:hypothetical protein